MNLQTTTSFWSTLLDRPTHPLLQNAVFLIEDFHRLRGDDKSRFSWEDAQQRARNDCREGFVFVSSDCYSSAPASCSFVCRSIWERNAVLRSRWNSGISLPSAYSKKVSLGSLWPLWKASSGYIHKKAHERDLQDGTPSLHTHLQASQIFIETQVRHEQRGCEEKVKYIASPIAIFKETSNSR